MKLNIPYEEKMEFVLHTHAHTQTHTLTHNHMKLTQSLLPPDIQQHLQKEYKLDEWKT